MDFNRVETDTRSLTNIKRKNVSDQSKKDRTYEYVLA